MDKQNLDDHIEEVQEKLVDEVAHIGCTDFICSGGFVCRLAEEIRVTTVELRGLYRTKLKSLTTRISQLVALQWIFVGVLSVLTITSMYILGLGISHISNNELGVRQEVFAERLIVVDAALEEAHKVAAKQQTVLSRLDKIDAALEESTKVATRQQMVLNRLNKIDAVLEEAVKVDARQQMVLSRLREIDAAIERLEKEIFAKSKEK